MTSLKELRQRSGITQHQLAERLGVGQSTVAMWESGESFPRADKFPELARILGCTINDLFSD